MTPAQAAEAIRNSNGQFVGVTFVKRSTGERRDMVCRFGKNRHLKGGDRAYDPAKHNLLPVFAMHEHGWRSIPIDGITEIRIDGRVEEVKA